MSEEVTRREERFVDEALAQSQLPTIETTSSRGREVTPKAVPFKPANVVVTWPVSALSSQQQLVVQRSVPSLSHDKELDRPGLD